MSFGEWVKYIFITLFYLLIVLAGGITFYEISNGNIESSVLLIVENIVMIVFALVKCFHLFLLGVLGHEDLPLDFCLGSYVHDLKVYGLLSTISLFVMGHLVFLGAQIYFIGVIAEFFEDVVVYGIIDGTKKFFEHILVVTFKILFPIALLAGIVVFVILFFIK